MINVKRLNSNIKASIAYIIGTIIGQGMTFLSIIVFTRLMDQDSYGRYSTYYAGISLFTVLIGANLFYSLNNAYIDFCDKIKNFRKTVLFLSSLICLAISSLAVLCNVLLDINIPSVIVICGSLHSYSFFVVNYRMFSANMENDYLKKTYLLILPNTLQFFIVLGIYWIKDDLSFELRAIGSSIGVFIVAFFSFVEILSDDGKLIDLYFWKYALKISVPSIVMSLSFILMQQCDKIMISNICNYEETAIYSVLFYFGYAIIAVDQAIAPVRQAWVYKKLSIKDICRITTIQKWYLYLFMILAVVLLLVGPYLLMIIAPKAYWKFEYICPFTLGACAMVMYRFITEILLYYKRNVELSLGVLICALLNVYLNNLSIKQYGAISATYTTIISYLLLFFITIILCNIKGQLVYSIKYFLIFLSYCIALFLIYILTLNGNNISGLLYSCVFLLCISWGIKNMKNLKLILNEKV